MTSFLKKIVLLFIPVMMLFSAALPADAYVNVRGYYRKDGTYVRPHVRSEPNGLKYDNYSWKPSQGLYNSTYGTRGATWDTPTWVTDPDYYEGKQLYEAGQSGYVAPKPVQKKIVAPANAYISGNDWYCNSGYFKSGSSCQKVIAPANAYVSGTTWYCNSGYSLNADRTGCQSITSSNLTCAAAYPGSAWNKTWQGNKLICDCLVGHKWNDAGTACVANIVEKAPTPIIEVMAPKCPSGARLYVGNKCICDGGYIMSNGVCTPINLGAR